MKEKVLVIQRDAHEHQVPLTKERVVFGRDAACDMVWNDPEFSREHVAIHNKHDAIYVENISTGGSMKINNKPTEYAELREGTEVVVGPYVIKWIYVSAFEKMSDPFSGKAQIQSQSGIKAFSDGISVKAEIEQTTPSGSDPLLAGDLPALAPLESTVNANAGDLEMNTEMRVAIANDDTVAQLTSAVGLIKITVGEIVGREIRLEHGKEWLVGRARECHVSIDNPKLSRHHFKIVQIGGGFRVHDLDSSYGVKVNGVSVKDAPLKSFDRIIAGPVEMQFAVIDKHLKEIPAMQAVATTELPSVMRDDPYGAPHNLHSERTNWPPAVHAGGGGHFQYSKPSLENSHSQGNFVSVGTPDAKTLPKDRILQLIQNFKEQPPARKILIVLLPLLIILGALSTFAPEESPQVVEKPPEAETPKEIVAEENPAESAQFTPEFQLKSAKEKAEIQALYAEAEEARNKGDWQRAFDLARGIVARVGKYKRTSDIIGEAQDYLNDQQVASFTRMDNDSEAVAAANKVKVDELLKQGEEALNEKRWDDAGEIYAKAIVLDPRNDKALRGQVAAQQKDATALGKALEIERDLAEQKPAVAPSVVAPVERAPPPPAGVTVEALSQDYQAAKQKIQEGAFREALPLLLDQKNEIERMIAEDESTRNPAAVIAEDKRNMRAKIMESLEIINDQFSLEYKTQMDDAQQAIANQKYVEARALYDTIIKREPLYEDPRIEREKLYRKMMSDGQTAYREGLVSESVGDLTTATEYYEKAKSYFESISKKEAEEYYGILDKKLRVLKK